MINLLSYVYLTLFYMSEVELFPHGSKNWEKNTSWIKEFTNKCTRIKHYEKMR